MSAPSGSAAVLAFKPESSWGTSPNPTNASSTYRLYFDSFTPENNRVPLDFVEIKGGTVGVDHSDFVEGGIEVGGSLTFTQRYAGMHALLNGFALGALATSTSTHTATLATTLPSLEMVWMPPNTAVGTYDDHRFSGMMVQSATWSHRAGEPMKCTLNFLGKGHTYDSSPLAFSSMAVPAEDIVQWHDKEADSGSTTGIQLEVQGSAPVEINCLEWELTLDNALVRRYIIQNGRYSAQPARDGKRLITLRMTIDKDAAWREFQTAMGASSTTDTTDTDVTLHYEDNADSALTWQALVANCRVTNLPAVVADDGFLTETVEMRAHYQSGGENQDDPLLIAIANNDTTDWGALI